LLGPKISLQYSTHFYEQSGLLYLYWPCEWDPVEEAACLLLGTVYCPPRVHELKVIKFDRANRTAVLHDIKFVGMGDVKPRIGSTMWSLNDREHYIFGGYYGDEDDFGGNLWGVSVMKIN
jgi:hypothetical protein